MLSDGQSVVGTDTITDFDANDANEKIDLAAVTNINSFTDLQSGGTMVQNLSGDVVITDGADTITLVGVNLGDLDASDFIF